nr:uncharacterized protein LOC111427594 [Onthophagus taurus]
MRYQYAYSFIALTNFASLLPILLYQNKEGSQDVARKLHEVPSFQDNLTMSTVIINNLPSFENIIEVNEEIGKIKVSSVNYQNSNIFAVIFLTLIPLIVRWSADVYELRE